MTDPHALAGTPDRGPSAPTFFDPSFERLPAPVSGDSATPGPVLLLFDRDADRDWVADAAVALATGWHAAGRRTVLADLCLDDPFLHERIGMPNQEGVVDIFLYGASLARSARAVPGRGFYLISSGTYTPDAGEVLRSPRWEKIVAGFRDANAALLLFAPSDAPELAAIGRFADDAIVLGGGDGPGALPASVAGVATRAWLAPPRTDGDRAPAAAPATPADRFPEPEPVSPWNAPPGSYAPPVPTAEATGALPTAAEAAYAPPAGIPAPEADWREPEPPKKKRVSPVLLVLLLIVLLAALAVVLAPQLGISIPFLAPAAAEEAPAPAPKQAAAAPAAQRGPPQPQGAALPYSVYVANYQSFAEASRFAAQASGKFSEARFFVFPEPKDGVVWWRVMAGMAADTTAVLALRDRLLAAGLVDEDEVGGRYDLIQSRPLAYEVGEFATIQEATARGEELANREIPVYVTPVPYSDGTERWKVYAGAYRDSASAAPMKSKLEGARIPAKMVERTGRPPASPK
ncbi:MAG TPA: SPOR domain-containing protein [Longimicrobium sp.]|jgi:hypothetical protein|uniref:SPOR domain-containing protein n=1 Tax=Longimicrobium sp. TaxID=2029185 RepID=UPI002EDAD501